MGDHGGRKSQEDKYERSKRPGDLAVILRAQLGGIDQQPFMFVDLFAQFLQRHPPGLLFNFLLVFGQIQRDKIIFKIQFIEIFRIFQVRLIGGAVHELELDLVFAGDGAEFPALGDDGARRTVGLRLVNGDVVHFIVFDPVDEKDLVLEGVDKKPRFQKRGRVFDAEIFQELALFVMGVGDDAFIQDDRQQADHDPDDAQRHQEPCQKFQGELPFPIRINQSLRENLFASQNNNPSSFPQ